MTTPWIEPNLAILITLGVGAAVLGLCGVLRKPGRSSLTSRLVVGAIVVLAVGASVFAARMGQPPEIWAPLLGLIGVWGFLLLLRVDAVVGGAAWLFSLLRRPRVQAACLLLGGPAVAVAFVVRATADDQEFLQEFCSELRVVPAGRQFEAIEPSPVTTDKGTVITIRTRLDVPPMSETLAEQSRIIRNLKLTEHIITMPPSDDNCNCHGWAFTGGRYWIESKDVDTILRENGYQKVTVPHPGDLAIYREADGMPGHTGVVRVGGDGPILIESKWGGLGRFIHEPDSHPYGTPTLDYYRSARRGHLLRGLPGVPTGEEPVWHYPPFSPRQL